MKIDCLMGTSGRFTLACQSLACFLNQSALSNATLLVYNQHPIPLRFEHPRVRVVNEKPPEGPLRVIQKRMLDLADPSADLIHWWDDDDLYLPWHLRDCLENVSPNLAWKPARSWMSVGNTSFSLEGNNFEASCVFRAEAARAAPIDTHPHYICHPIFMQTVEACQLATSDLGGRTSYIYRWATGAEHLSAFGGSVDAEVQKQNAELWRQRSTDFRLGGKMVPADLSELWNRYLVGTKSLVTPDDWEHNRRGVGL